MRVRSLHLCGPEFHRFLPPRIISLPWPHSGWEMRIHERVEGVVGTTRSRWSLLFADAVGFAPPRWRPNDGQLWRNAIFRQVLPVQNGCIGILINNKTVMTT
jgi:hypothetical protein